MTVDETQPRLLGEVVRDLCVTVCMIALTAVAVSGLITYLKWCDVREQRRRTADRLELLRAKLGRICGRSPEQIEELFRRLDGRSAEEIEEATRRLGGSSPG